MEHIDGMKNAHPVLELDREKLNGTYAGLARLLEVEPDPNKVYEAHGDHGLLQVLRDQSPDVLAQLIETQAELDNGEGYVVIRNTGVEDVSPELAQLNAITLASVYGRPTRTDQRKAQIAWPIRYDPNATGNKTFSQTMGEAAYHTDTQYFEQPEKYFGLFCVASDEPGKGTNKLVDGAAVMQRIDEETPEVGATRLRMN